jgi:UDP-N-acetylglucosamine--N-acetylmuramyl-(pentapeptide) pyrophosphoryl-undecaprenol N-acetylglucosamine transferase
MNAPDRAPVLVAAGGTGGHLFPAEALAAALIGRGIPVHLATDRRAAGFGGGTFADDAVHVVASATLRGRDPLAVTRTAAMLGLGLLQGWTLIGRLKPAAVIGFGGYPTIPPVMAATWRGVPTLIHDANAVIGRANRLLAPRVTAIATSFPDLFHNDPALAAKATLTGNPVRPMVVAAAATPYPAPTDPLRLLIFGGSQGARIMADVVPAAIKLIAPELRARLAIVQQARAEDLDRVRSVYGNLTLPFEVAPFFSDLPVRIAAISSLRAPVPQPSPNFRPSAGHRSWCRCRMRSIRTNSPMPACWRKPAAPYVWRRINLHPGGLPTKSRQ